MGREISPGLSVNMTSKSGTVIKLGELVMILELHRQGLKVSAIARQFGLDRKTVRNPIAQPSAVRQIE
jgi:DNA-binding NarL/FixJ family response regulator